MTPDNDNHIRHQVRLPSGKEIEVVYLDPRRSSHTTTGPERGAPRPVSREAHKARGAAKAVSPARSRKVERPAPALHVCRACAGELVYPMDWAEEREGYWRVLLRCPDCEQTRDGVFGQAAVEELDDQLDRATGALLSDFRRMAHANMAQEIDFFVRALNADVIVPSDF
jgi:hypothetical protein